MTWATAALTSLLKGAGTRLVQLNGELEASRDDLERRVAERTDALKAAQARVIQQQAHHALAEARPLSARCDDDIVDPRALARVRDRASGGDHFTVFVLGDDPRARLEVRVRDLFPSETIVPIRVRQEHGDRARVAWRRVHRERHICW